MLTVTPRRAETLEESSERRWLFCLRMGGSGSADDRGRDFDGEGRRRGEILFSFVGVRHDGQGY